MDNAELDKLGNAYFKQHQREHAKGILKTSRADQWQRAYELHGKASLKFRYPLTEPPLTKEQREERKQLRKASRKRNYDDRARLMAKLDSEYACHWENKMHAGEPIPRGVLDCLREPPTLYHDHYLVKAVHYCNCKLADRLEAYDNLT